MQFGIPRIPCTVSHILRPKRVAAAVHIMAPLRTVAPVGELVLKAVDRRDAQLSTTMNGMIRSARRSDDAPGANRSPKCGSWNA